MLSYHVTYCYVKQFCVVMMCHGTVRYGALCDVM